MKIIIFCRGKRGIECLKPLSKEGADLSMVVLQQNDLHNKEIKTIAKEFGIEIYAPSNPNSKKALTTLAEQKADIFVLAGYGLILKKECFSIPKLNCINLHGGKLPQYRGSSPLNWALINGEENVGISVIEVDEGIDTGLLLAESELRIDSRTTIADLHKWANAEFSKLLVKVINQISNGILKPQKQDSALSCYYPKRFPEDGLILWDQINCNEAHNKIRALSSPYPCAFSFFKGRKIKFVSSRLSSRTFIGEPGRIYRKSNGSFLISAKDQALWITEAIFVDDHSTAYDGLKTYESLSTISQIARQNLLRPS